MQQRCAGLQRLLGAEHRGQLFVFDLNEVQRLLGDVWAGGGDGGDGVPFVQRLVGSQDVVAEKPHVVQHALGEIDHPAGGLRQVPGRHHRMHARQFLGMPGVDRLDARVAVGAAQHHAVQHARQPDVGTVARLAGDLLGPVVADGPLAHLVEFRIRQDHVVFVIEHGKPPISG